MRESLQIIRLEHRRLAAVLQCLQDVLSDVVAGRTEADFEFYELAIGYLENYLFRFHHPKEDQYLFPRLRDRCRAAEELTRELERQHERGDVLLEGLRGALQIYRRHPDDASRGEFGTAVRAYHDYERAHMRREESELLPLAREHLTDADWRIIDDAFQAHRDPLFGDVAQQDLRAHFSRLAGSAPAPHGLG